MNLHKESKKHFLLTLAASCLLTLNKNYGHGVHAFAPTPSFCSQNINIRTPTSTQIHASSLPAIEIGGPEIGFDQSCVMTKEEIKPIVTLKKGEPKEKMINAFGFFTILISLIVNPIWSLAMYITDAVCNAFPDLDENRAAYDMTGKIWAKTWLGLSDSYPSISGDVERLKEDNDLGACLFVANHASWLDIPVLCTVLDPVFKFIAKGELKSVPCIGQQLVGGKHIMIDREDRRSQLRTFKEGVNWLNNGVPLMAFPEGKRSDDGRLDEFKGGIFSMAVRAKVPIVPISISNTHAIMPANSLFPVQKGKGKLHVHVHPPISVEDRKEDELAELVRTALLSKMPLDQHPLPVIDDAAAASEDDDANVNDKNQDSIKKELLKA